jgi:hypothetical protein
MILTRTRTGLVALALAGCGAIATLAAAAPETFTATATVKKGGASASAPVTVNVTKYATDAERESARKTIREGGTAGLKAMLGKMPDAGFIQLGDRKTAVKFAMERPTSGGRLITAVTAQPILYLGGGVPDSQAVAGYDVAIAMFEVQTSGSGVGDLSPAAKVELDDKGALVIGDYGKAVVWLNNIAVKR